MCGVSGVGRVLLARDTPDRGASYDVVDPGPTISKNNDKLSWN